MKAPVTNRLAALLVAITALTPSALFGQSMSASRASADLNAAPECTITTCIEAEATRAPLCVVHVVDNSGSMDDTVTGGGTRLDSAQANVNAFIDLMDASTDLVGVVSFNGPGLFDGPLDIDRDVDPVTSDFTSAKAAVLAINQGDGDQLTPTAAAIDTAALLLDDCPAGAARIVILTSDGLPTWSDGSCDTSPTSPTDCTNDAIAAAGVLKAAGVQIVTIGIDLDDGNASEAFGIEVLEDIASSPVDANFVNTGDGLGGAEIYMRVDSIASPAAVAYTDTLNACWSYETGTTTGATTDEPTTGSGGTDIQTVTWDLGHVPDGETPQICYTMSYDPLCGGNVAASVSVHVEGGAAWTNFDASTDFDQFGSSNVDISAECQSILPVELVSFTASVDDQDIVLLWETASETNNAGFDIEHSFGESSFVSIAFVDGHGTTLSPQTYEYRVETLEPGVHRFRLKQIDYDGAFTYSAAVEVDVELPDRYYLSQVYPNPFNPQASIRFAVAETQVVKMTLHDATGRQIATLFEDVASEGGTHAVSIDGSNLASGTYLVRLQGVNFIDSRTMTILK